MNTDKGISFAREERQECGKVKNNNLKGFLASLAFFADIDFAFIFDLCDHCDEQDFLLVGKV